MSTMAKKSFLFVKLKLPLLVFLGLTTPASAAPILLNSTFENNNVSSGSYLYAGTVVAEPWVFDGGSGISANSSAWSGYTSNGNYFVFLQNTSSVSQTFNSDGDYKLDISFDMVERTAGYSPDQVVEVWFDGTRQTSINPESSWNTYTLNDIAIGSGSHSLEFRGISTYEAAGDASAFLDNIQMTSRPVPEPATVSLLAVGLIPWIIRRWSA